jgi:hypothetical protein
METLALLCRIGQIKLCTRLDVVNMPTCSAVIPPSHAGLELVFQPNPQLLRGASDQR